MTRTIVRDLVVTVSSTAGWRAALARMLTDTEGNVAVFTTKAKPTHTFTRAHEKNGNVHPRHGKIETSDGQVVTYRVRGSSCSWEIAKCNVKTPTLAALWPADPEPEPNRLVASGSPVLPPASPDPYGPDSASAESLISSPVPLGAAPARPEPSGSEQGAGEDLTNDPDLTGEAWEDPDPNPGPFAGSPEVEETDRPAPGPPPVSKVRAWARDNGYEVSDRGRIPGHIIEAYREENG